MRTVDSLIRATAIRLRTTHLSLDQAFAVGDPKLVLELRKEIRVLEDGLSELVYGESPTRREERRRSDLYRAAGEPSHFGRQHTVDRQTGQSEPPGIRLSADERRHAVRLALGEFAGFEIGTGEEEPETVIRIGDSGSLLAPGEPMILTGPPGVGKSTLVLQLIAGAAAGFGPWTDVAGLSVRSCPCVLASWEDGQSRLGRRIQDLGIEPSPALFAIEMAARPLYSSEGSDRTGPTRHWRPFWHEVRALFQDGRDAFEGAGGPGILVLDPALAAYGSDDTLGSGVREFVSAVSTEAAEIGVGVVIIHHPSKRGRPGMDRVGGSVQWTAAARAVLHLGAAAAPEQWILSVEKANYAPQVKLRLRRHGASGAFEEA